jgi:hypothetical protein
MLQLKLCIGYYRAFALVPEGNFVVLFEFILGLPVLDIVAFDRVQMQPSVLFVVVNDVDCHLTSID